MSVDFHRPIQIFEHRSLVRLVLCQQLTGKERPERHAVVERPGVGCAAEAMGWDTSSPVTWGINSINVLINAESLGT